MSEHQPTVPAIASPEYRDHGAPALASALGGYRPALEWLSACQGTYPPEAPRRCRLVMFSATSGSEKPHTDPALSAIAATAGAGISIVTLDSVTNSPATPAPLTVTQAAFQRGRDAADHEVDGGADLLCVAGTKPDMQRAAAVLIGAGTGTEPVRLMPQDYTDPEQWKATTQQIRDAMFQIRGCTGDPLRVLHEVGSLELSAMCGFLLQAAVRRTPVILDGVASLAAAVWAHRLAPDAHQWWCPGHPDPAPGYAEALGAMQLTPILPIPVRSDTGLGALLTLPVLTLAAEYAREAAVPDTP